MSGHKTRSCSTATTSCDERDIQLAGPKTGGVFGGGEAKALVQKFVQSMHNNGLLARVLEMAVTPYCYSNLGDGAPGETRLPADWFEASRSIQLSYGRM